MLDALGIPILLDIEFLAEKMLAWQPWPGGRNAFQDQFNQLAENFMD